MSSIANRQAILEFAAAESAVGRRSPEIHHRFGVVSEYQWVEFYILVRRGDEVEPVLRSSDSFSDALGYYLTLGMLTEGGPPRFHQISEASPTWPMGNLLLRKFPDDVEVGIASKLEIQEEVPFSEVLWRPASEVNEELNRGLLIVPLMERPEPTGGSPDG